MNLEKIEILATKFRDAIEDYVQDATKNCISLPPSLKSFPEGSCGDTSLLLGIYLRENGINAYYVHGERGNISDSTWQTHAWLQYGRIIIDITADQFEEIKKNVIVTTDSRWHKSFEQVEKRDNYQLNDCPSSDLETAYRNILARIDTPRPNMHQN